MKFRPASPVGVVEARRRLGKLISDASVRHQPAVLANGKALSMLLGMDEVAQLTSSLSFHPEVSQEGDEFSIWLPEFGIYGQGHDLDTAVDDLVNEVSEYIDQYLSGLDRYRQAPNRAQHFPYVLRALALEATGNRDPGAARRAWMSWLE